MEKKLVSEKLDQALNHLAQQTPPPYQCDRMLSEMKEAHNDRRRTMKVVWKTAGLFLPILFILMMVLIPVSYEVTVGGITLVRGTLPPQHSGSDVLALKPLPEEFNRNVSTEGQKAEITVAHTSRDSKEFESRLLESFEAIGLSGIEVSTEVVRKEVRGSALAAITGGSISVNVENLSEEEAEAEIMSALSERGYTAGNVEVTRDGEQMTISIEDLEGAEGELSIQVEDGAGE